MTQNEILTAARAFILDLYKGESTGHDYWHSVRVANTAKLLASRESADPFLAELIALLHDADDIKLFPETHREKAHAVSFLRNADLPEHTIKTVCRAIDAIPFNGTGASVPDTIEGKCVQDADRLDAIGAIGIARTFAYGGKHARPIYDPSEQPNLAITEEIYRNSRSSSVSHFYEKLLRIKDLMNTESGKALAEERDQFMRTFLDEFYKEWDGGQL